MSALPKVSKEEREERRRKRKAVKLALQALGEMAQKISFDAAMFDQYGQENYLLGKRASERKKEINQARDVICEFLEKCDG